MLEFWTRRGGKPFAARELPAGKGWLKDEYSTVALGDALFIRNDGLWTCELMVPGTAHHYAVRLLPETERQFGTKELPASDRAFIRFVYHKRRELLKKDAVPDAPSGIENFVKERLSRCGLETFRADIGSLAELWDIFDDYEFQVLMGRIQ
jgi:hypothetical protein